jgi:RimJ/RimL family protein N-acetyltransferase
MLKISGPQVAELPADLRLRQLERDDRERVLAVLDNWWGRPMGGLLPRPFFTEFRDTSLVIERDGEPVAFLVGFLSQTRPEDAYIHAVAVAPPWRGQGLATLLYQRFAAVVARHGCRHLRAITRPSNAGSLAFHRRLGFNFELPSAPAGDARVELVLDLPRPTSFDLGAGDLHDVAAALGAPLAGSSVALEPLTRANAPDLALAAADSDWRWLPIDASSSAGFERWFESMLALAGNADPRNPWTPFAVLDRRDRRAIGSSSFHAIHPEHRRVEIGMTWYARSEWGSGANIEAKLLMLGRAFELGFQRVEFKTDARNERSRRALAALPAQFEGVLRKHMLTRAGERRDSAYYSVVDDDWPEVRANLERRLKLRQGEGRV